MSGKEEKESSRSPGAKVIKKALSLRDKIIRRPSTSSQHSITPPQKSPKNVKNKPVTRGSSFSEGTSITEKKKKDHEVDRLKQDSKKVFQALKYTQDVVDKNILQQLPGSATVVLETIMEVTTRLLSNYAVNQDSSVLISTFNQVYQSLANLIRWADKVMLDTDNQPVNKDVATETINAVKDGINDLLKLSIDKLERQGSSSYCNRTNGRPGNPMPEKDTRTSMPEIPLTPREKEILEQTQLPHFSFDNMNINAKLNNNCNELNSLLPPEDMAPPPKPPLPKDYMSTLGSSLCGSPEREKPPPLPEKRRGNSVSLESPTSPPFRTDVFGEFFNGSGVPSFASYSTSPVSSTPLSMSPCSSVGSGINRSSEDLLSDNFYRENGTPIRSVEQTVSDYDNSPNMEGDNNYSPARYVDRQLSDYDNTDSTGSSAGEINNLTQQIQGLISNIDSNSSKQLPAVPIKRVVNFAAQSGSDYDNLVNVNPQDILAKMRSEMDASVTSQLAKFGSGTPPFSTLQSDILSGGPSLLQSSKMMQPTAFQGGDLTNHGSPLSISCGSPLSNMKPDVLMSSQMGSPVPHNYHMQMGIQRTTRSQVVQKKVISTQTFHSSQSSQQMFQSSSQPHSHSFSSTFTSSESSAKSESSNGCKQSFVQETKAYGEQNTSATLPTGERVSNSKSLAHASKTFAKKELDMVDGDSPPRMRAKFAHQSRTEGVNTICSAEGIKREVMRGGEAMAGISEGDSDGLGAPPLPPKKKNIEAYMQTLNFAGYSEPNFLEYSRHSMVPNRFYQEKWYQHQVDFFTPFQRSNTISIAQMNRHTNYIEPGSHGNDPMLTPTLPPKRNRSFSTLTASLSDQNLTRYHPCHDQLKAQTESISGQHSLISTMPPAAIMSGKENIPTKSSSLPERTVEKEPESNSLKRLSFPISDEIKEVPASRIEKKCSVDEDEESNELIFAQDVYDYIVKCETGEIRGGPVDALTVYATSVGKNDFMYQEAFLTTYRTMISPRDLIKKLLARYNKFCHSSDDKKKRLSRNTFSLIIRIVDELCNDINDTIIEDLSALVFQLLCDGELMLARVLRKTLLEKCRMKQALEEASHQINLLSHQQIYTKKNTLLDFKSHDIATQMTMLDAELFQKIEIPEMLLWSKEQNEEMSPNLTTFTMHFNKMSYWVRSLILEKSDAKEREKYLVKFLKIMKELRKLKNFNSYLALLSAVDSAPIRRLEWQKQIMDTLKEMSELINSSSSFKVYRQVLADTEPPCIPYIGLILQDLTFIHIGNQDVLPDGNINFTKRWQQFNILEALRRFKKCHFDFPKNKNIITFFNNFDDYLSEEALWQISESLKPRGGKPKT